MNVAGACPCADWGESSVRRLIMSLYSMDLRQRVVAAHQAGEGSIRELADVFHVAENTIEN